MPETAASPLVLTITYWLHMLATVVWVGGLAAVSLFVLPAARKSLDPTAFSTLLSRLQASLQRVGWFSLAVLIVTGMFQMSSSPFYHGFLAINNEWAAAILTKHLVIGLMILTSVYATWGLLPALKRAALLRAAGRGVDEAQAARLQNREIWLLRANLALAVIVLLLTAWARSASK
jgi:uncharacterized membrane protein